jgi:DNA repair exonuclease SbcCD ATPase subunit
MSKERIKDLELILEKKYEVFCGLYEITRKQQEDIRKHEGDNIEALIEEKQQLIHRIDGLDESFLKGYEMLRRELQLDTFKDMDDKRYPELKNLKGMVGKITELVQGVMALEKSNQEELEEIFQKVKRELKQVNTGKRSLQAYEPAPVYNDGIYIDKKVR